jgi:uncharacterized protein
MTSESTYYVALARHVHLSILTPRGDTMISDVNPKGALNLARPEEFMDFKFIDLHDRQIFMDLLKADPPHSSELTFTNLFMWRRRYQPVWTMYGGCILIIMKNDAGEYYGLPPIGPGEKHLAIQELFTELSKLTTTPKISRADRSFVEKYVDKTIYDVKYDRDNSDYVYCVEHLAKLSGNRYHKKKNHINSFKKNYKFEYRDLNDEIIDSALALQEDWCEFRNCSESPDLSQEDRAIFEALVHFDALQLKGGAILVDGKMEAFTIGEMLNPETVVIHIEKANPQIRGLYPMINKAFLSHAWSNIKFVNREQDLGIEGLRHAKESYYPDHMVDKFDILIKD